MSVERSNKKRVLLIGWDAADWKIINPLVEAGRMPTLEILINNGVMGKLATLEPTFSPMLWTSIATGKTADKHGILGFIEPTPEGDGIRPVNVTSRRSRAVWNILHNKGMHTNLVNWWPSYPAEPINGVVVSNYFPKATDKADNNESTSNVWPAEWFDRLKAEKIRPEEITGDELLNFVPEAALVDQDKDRSLVKLSVITAENLTVFQVTRKLMQETDWDLTAAYFGGIDQFCHQFMKYYPPKPESTDEEEFHLYRNVINEAYIFHDEMLKRLLAETDENTTVMLVSDHGFHSDHLRPHHLPGFTAAAAMEHSPYGIICMAGPGIKKDERIYGSSLLDITPTILSLFDLPVGADMDGKPLFSAFSEAKKVERIVSWDSIDGDFGTHDPSKQVNTFAAVTAMQQLVDLGYIDPPEENITLAIEKTREETSYNLSRTYLGLRRYTEARAILEELYEGNREDIRFNLDLLRCYIELREPELARELVRNIEQLKEGNRPSIELLKGMLLVLEKEYGAAIDQFRKVEEEFPGFPNLQTNLGNACLKAGLYEDAIKAYENALIADDGNAGAYRGMAICSLRLKRYEKAAEYALTAISLFYSMPLAHYHLGDALYYLENYEDAARAYEMALKMAPDLYKARLRLKKIYEEKLMTPDMAGIHIQILEQLMKGEILIVSGLPRSGTSMMMQMLTAGGVDPLTDGLREPDSNNPRGYFEYTPVKRIKKDTSFMDQAVGRSVKVIAQLLKYLPPQFTYKVIFMKRDIHEIIVSQQKMIGKSSNDYPMELLEVYEKELEQVDVLARKEPNIDILYVSYDEVLANTAGEAERIIAFTGLDLDHTKMCGEVKEELYRNRITSLSR